MYHLSIINSWKGEVPMKTLKRVLVTLVAVAMMAAGVSALAFAASSPSVTDIGKADVTLSATEFSYNGSTQQPKVTVKYDGEKLTKGTDYKVSVEKGSAVGSYNVTITGIGLFDGTVNKTYTITKADLSSANAVAEPVPYTGEAQTADITVTDANGNTLTEGTDYTVKNATKTDAATYQVTITGKGNYTGTTTVDFKIGKANLTRVTATAKTVTYTGKVRTAVLTVTDTNGKELVKGTDYTVTNAKQTDADTYMVIIEGINNYKGSQEVPFTIKQADLEDATATAATVTYTGDAQTAVLKVKDAKDNELTLGTDYTVSNAKKTDAGTYTVKITGKGNYTGSTTATFTISEVDLDNVTATAKTVTYTGDEQTAVLTVKDANGNKLKKGTDYTVSNATKTDAGTYKVTIKGKGNYTGSTKVEFTIAKADISDATAKAASVVYTGKAQTAVLTVKDANGNKLTKGTDYTVKNATQTDAATYQVKITGKGNYTGTKTVEFKIGSANVGRLTITVKNVTYTGKAQTPVVTVKTSDGKKLTANKDYTVTKVSETAAGTYKVTVAGKGNYYDSTEVDFTINKATQSVKASAKTASFKASALKKKAVSTKITVSGVKDDAKVQYTCSSKYVTIKNGTVTLAKGTPKGTYKVTVSIGATKNYKAVTKTISITVK
jgi:uncharacterized Zn ribbon protein